MLQISSDKFLNIVLKDKNPYENINTVDNYIDNCNCKYMTVDITKLNVIDACMVSVLCSTKHYLKYPDGKINWVTNCSEVEDYTKSMKLGNGVFEVIK